MNCHCDVTQTPLNIFPNNIIITPIAILAAIGVMLVIFVVIAGICVCSIDTHVKYNPIPSVIVAVMQLLMLQSNLTYYSKYSLMNPNFQAKYLTAMMIKCF